MAISATDVAFIGSGSGGQEGVYTAAMSQPTDPPGFIPFQRRIADASTPISGGLGTFESFSAVGLNATDIVFLGHGSGGQSGIFDFRDDSLTSLVKVGDILDGKMITGLSFTGGGLFQNSIAFGAFFEDGSQGIYTMNVPEPSSLLTLALGSLMLGIARLHRRRHLTPTC